MPVYTAWGSAMRRRVVGRKRWKRRWFRYSTIPRGCPAACPLTSPRLRRCLARKRSVLSLLHLFSTALHRTPPRLHLLSILLFICFLNLCHHMLSQGDDADISPGIQASEAPARYSLRTVRAGGGAIGVAGGRKQRGNHSASAPNAIPGAAASSSASADISYAVPEAEAEEEPEADGDGFSGGDGFDDEWAAEQEVEAEAAEEVVAEEAEEEVPEAEVDAPARGLPHSSRLHRHTMNTLRSTAPATQPTGGVGAVKKSSVRGGEASAPPTRRFGFLRSQPLPNHSGPLEVNLRGSRSASNLAAASSSKQPAPYQVGDEDDELHVLPPAAEKVCGRDGCTKPDRHPGMCDVQQMPRQRARKAPADAAATASARKQSADDADEELVVLPPRASKTLDPLLDGLLGQIRTNSDDAEFVVEEEAGAAVEVEEEEEHPEAAVGLCGTWGCTLPDKHSGLHEIPIPPARRAAAVAGREKAARQASGEASQEPGPSEQSAREAGGASNDDSNREGSGAGDDAAESGRAPKQRVNRAFPFHLTQRGIWMREGLSAEDTRNTRAGMVIGERVHFLLDQDPTLTPGAMATWKRGDAPLEGWAPGWEPINKQTVSADETTNDLGHCKSLTDKMNNMLGNDWDGILDGARLPEADTPAEEYMDYSTLIRCHNTGLGYCLRCLKVMAKRAKIKRPQARDEGEPYGRLGDVWSAERQENFLMHVKSNVLPRPICRYACPLACPLPLATAAVVLSVPI